MAKYPTCKSCGQPLKFLSTPSGGHMPCDPKMVFYAPCADGPDKIVAGNGVVVRCKILDTATRDCKAGLVPHWSTCPGAVRHRKQKSRQPGQHHQTSLFDGDRR